jgi:hypothetical protein
MIICDGKSAVSLPPKSYSTSLEDIRLIVAIVSLSVESALPGDE